MTAAISLAASEPEDIGAGALAEGCSAERLAQAKADMHEMKGKFPPDLAGSSDVAQAIFGNRRAEWYDLYHGPGLFRRAGRAWGAVGAAARSACS